MRVTLRCSQPLSGATTLERTPAWRQIRSCHIGLFTANPVYNLPLASETEFRRHQKTKAVAEPEYLIQAVMKPPKTVSARHVQDCGPKMARIHSIPLHNSSGPEEEKEYRFGDQKMRQLAQDPQFLSTYPFENATTLHLEIL